ncbi:MAG TPA: triose-phosphate isomerase [Rhodanobacteraceae bacterium]|nr:triose-phosphate isomerase [Rhodanobacteraceae bacterium]
MSTRTKMVAANWKMHGSRAQATAWLDAVAGQLPPTIEAVLFPPLPYLQGLIAMHGGGPVGFGAQDVSEHQQPGAFTGETSAAMLADIGCAHVLVGHCERRRYHGESDAQVAAKFVAARAAGLQPMLCVGETVEQRDAGETDAVLARQLGAVVEAAGIAAFADAAIAYEPAWAIGTGRTATPMQAQAAHAFIRSQLAGRDAKLGRMVRVVYGGSVKPDNARDLFSQPDVDGGLVGGASLSGADFLAICRAAC